MKTNVQNLDDHDHAQERSSGSSRPFCPMVTVKVESMTVSGQLAGKKIRRNLGKGSKKKKNN